MAKVKCYDPQGNEYLMEPVDARECLQHLGYTMEPAELPFEPPTGKAGMEAGIDLEALTKDQLMEMMDSKGIEYNVRMNKSELIARLKG